jgi:hypothetical protein
MVPFWPVPVLHSRKGTRRFEAFCSIYTIADRDHPCQMPLKVPPCSDSRERQVRVRVDERIGGLDEPQGRIRDNRAEEAATHRTMNMPVWAH